ncbi:MAG: hypothetical protein WCK55_17395 [Verrucomicrobiota bacterium]
MSTLVEIENAVAELSQGEQQKLLRHLSAKLRVRVVAAGEGRRKRWPVPPPKVSKAESQRVARRIEGEFGRVEWESWK